VFFWRKRKPRKPLLRATITDQQRRTYRAAIEFPIVYALEGRAGTRSALANDLSAGGMRLIGDEDFAEDALIDIRFTLPNDLIRGVHIEREIVQRTLRGPVKKKIMVPPDPFAEISLRGKVVIALPNVRRHKFAHGIQFIEVEEKTQEELQRFVHVWQIRQLRERAHLRRE
jgi:c-di-GMP-binding flagellar brake protein YcgR